MVERKRLEQLFYRRYHWTTARFLQIQLTWKKNKTWIVQYMLVNFPFSNISKKLPHRKAQEASDPSSELDWCIYAISVSCCFKWISSQACHFSLPFPLFLVMFFSTLFVPDFHSRIHDIVRQYCFTSERAFR